MTIKDGVVTDCEIAKGGHCAMHGVEVERRRHNEEKVNDIEARINSNHKRIGELLTFKNNAIGYTKGLGLLASVVLLGTYSYTYTSTQRLRADAINYTQNIKIEHAELKGELKAVNTEINTLRDRLVTVERDSSLTNERYINLSNKVDLFDRRLEQLITILMESEKLQRNKAENGISGKKDNQTGF